MKPPGFSALLLAGGRSSRMGVDKATLNVAGALLWQRQLATLRATGASAVAVAGRPDGPYATTVTVLEDEHPGLGPLAGIVSGLRWCPSPVLLVLAIDLPAMTADFLHQLVSATTSGCGIVPRRGKLFEPLAAVYPREALSLAEEHLAGADRSLQRWLRACETAKLVRSRLLRDVESLLFTNLNTSADVRAQTAW